MSGGQATRNAVEIGRLRRDLNDALAAIELLKGDQGDTGAVGAVGAVGGVGPVGGAGVQGPKGDASDAPVKSVSGKLGHLSISADDISTGDFQISGNWSKRALSAGELITLLQFDQNYIYKHHVATAKVTFHLQGGIGWTDTVGPDPINGATIIIPITPHADGLAFTGDYEYFDLVGGDNLSMPEWKETEPVILVMQYHAADAKVYVQYRHPQWLKRSSADPTLLNFEWDAIHPEEVQAGVEVIDFATGKPFRTHGKKVLLPFESDRAGVTWGPEFVDIRDRDNATLPDLTDSEKYLMEMQYDEIADEVLVKSWPMEPIVMVVSDGDATQDCNKAVAAFVKWENNVRVKASTFSHSVVSQVSRLIALKPGYYSFNAYLSFSTITNGFGQILCQWEKNGTTKVGPAMSTTKLDLAKGWGACSSHIRHDIVLAANDYLRMSCIAGAAVFAAFPTSLIHCYVEKIG